MGIQSSPLPWQSSVCGQEEMRQVIEEQRRKQLDKSIS